MNVLITPLSTADVDSIAALARRIWQQTYLGIISQAQIDFMLEQRYHRQRLLDELTMPDIWWDQLHVDGQLAGFSSCLRIAGGKEMKLDKIYVDPGRQRLGLGARLIEHAAGRALALGCCTLILAVNKRNQAAIAAYRKHGFAVRESVCVDIGQGFVMDDFIMARSLLMHTAES